MIDNRYSLGAMIGEGGMGAVYRGQDTQTGKVVAIKILKPEIIAADPEMVTRFAREAEALRQLNHPNIVKVYNTGSDDNQHYIVMEYVSGGSLYDLLKTNQTLSISRVLTIALELADALTRAHHLKIIHRDLKPANVLLAEDGTPRLTDFGVAFIGAVPRMTKADSVVGTLDYLSPSAFAGEAPNTLGDIWAFGVILFEMLAGQHPFAQSSPAATINAILSQACPDLESLRPDMPVALVDLIYRMLEKDAHLRIASARQVGAALESILLGNEFDTASLDTSKVRALLSHDGTFDTPTPSSESVKHNLPTTTTPFVGREHEIAELNRLLCEASTRLVTILGPGGMGKTRLALEMGGTCVNTLPPTFINGIYFISLAPLASPDHIVTAMADALGFPLHAEETPKQQLLNYLREKSCLLIMDNFEHIIAGAGIVSDMLQAAPHLKVIATSREKLNLSGETVFNLGGMDFPEWETPTDALEYSAVKLFMQSARRTQPNFELLAGDLAYVARICRLVGGLPLGILLAAAWIDTLSLKEIVDEIGRSLDFLESEMRDLPERHRSIRAVFEYSWQLMTEDERNIFPKLAVFRGGFTRDAAMAVAGASLRNLMTLVNKSLLSRDLDGRYQIHELLRQYAEQRLGANVGAAQDAHAVYFSDVVAKDMGSVMFTRQTGLFALLETEMDNIRTAISWIIQNRRFTDLTKMIVPLYLCYQFRSLYREGVESLGKIEEWLITETPSPEVNLALSGILLAKGWLHIRLGELEQAQGALERSHSLRPEYGQSLTGLSLLNSIYGNYDKAIELGQAALASKQIPGWDTGMGEASASYTLASASMGKGDYQAARMYTERAYQLTVQLGEKWFASYVLIDLGHLERALGNYDNAAKHYETAYTYRKAFKDPEGMANTLSQLARIAFLQSDFVQAKQRYEDSLALYKDIGDRGGLATALSGLGRTWVALGDTKSAQAQFRQGLKLARELNSIPYILNVLLGIGEWLARTGQPESATAIFTLIQRHPASQHETRDGAQQLLEKLRPALTPEQFEAAIHRGQTLPLDDFNLIESLVD